MISLSCTGKEIFYSGHLQYHTCMYARSKCTSRKMHIFLVTPMCGTMNISVLCLGASLSRCISMDNSLYMLVSVSISMSMHVYVFVHAYVYAYVYACVNINAPLSIFVDLYLPSCLKSCMSLCISLSSLYI